MAACRSRWRQVHTLSGSVFLNGTSVVRLAMMQASATLRPA